MAARFCVSFPSTYGMWCSTFQADDGEVYTVAFDYADISFSLTNRRDITVSWKTIKSKYIEITNEQSGQKYKKLCTENCATATFSLTNITSNGILKISVTPHVPIKNGKLNVVPLPVTTPPKAEPVVTKKLEELSSDMETLLQTGHHSDVVLTDGAKEIPAHKIILSARSPVFLKMFEHPMKENIENRITIKDISIGVLEKMLHFLYTGTICVKDSSMARDLYVASHKYGVEGLTDICSAVLKTVDMSNVLDTLLLSDLHSDKNLKKAVLEFIAKNYSEFKALEKWSGFMKENQSLALEVLSFVIDKK